MPQYYFGVYFWSRISITFSWYRIPNPFCRFEYHHLPFFGKVYSSRLDTPMSFLLIYVLAHTARPPLQFHTAPRSCIRNQTLFHFITNPSRPLLPGRTLPLLPEFSSYIKKSPTRSSYRWLTLHCMFFFHKSGSYGNFFVKTWHEFDALGKQ